MSGMKLPFSRAAGTPQMGWENPSPEGRDKLLPPKQPKDPGNLGH